MDNSWLFENEEKEEEEEHESDEEDNQTELEERLYAVVHHNDLSQPLPSELAKHYTIQCADNGEIEVSLNNSLEAVKSADSEQICNLLKVSDSKNGEGNESNAPVSTNDDDDVVFVSSVEIKKTNDHNPNHNGLIQNKNGYKRFRYSDVTLKEFQGQGHDVESTTNDIYYFDHNIVLFESKKNKKFQNLKVPPPRGSSDWKNDSNLSFISVEPQRDQEKDIIYSMTKALIELNPDESKGKLSSFARILYRRNMQLFKRKKKRERKKARKLNQSSINDSSCNSSCNISREIEDLKEKIQEYKSETITNKRRREEFFNGSISLNISPFKPDPSLPQCVDLTLENEDIAACSSKVLKENSSPTSEVKNSHYPTKWTKKMKKFYSKRCKKEVVQDINKVIATLRKKSGGKDWYLDPEDQVGYYKRKSPGANKGVRCLNCNERGHLARNCYKPIKLPACTLCGELYHTDYSCPNKVCLKCGMFITSDVFGGECNDCYYTQFNSEQPCTICCEVTHKSLNCTDLWRSFHATIGGEKKIPDDVMVNKRKSCCNCGQQGHFSHDCPFITYSGQQISPFVKNYSPEPLQKGSVDVVISRNYLDIIYSDEGDKFFHTLSNNTQALIGINDVGHEIVCNINGTFEQCNKVKLEIENYLNTRKRKRQEPKSKRKRQRVWQ